MWLEWLTIENLWNNNETNLWFDNLINDIRKLAFEMSGFDIEKTKTLILNRYRERYWDNSDRYKNIEKNLNIIPIYELWLIIVDINWDWYIDKVIDKSWDVIIQVPSNTNFYLLLCKELWVNQQSLNVSNKEPHEILEILKTLNKLNFYLTVYMTFWIVEWVSLKNLNIEEVRRYLLSSEYVDFYQSIQLLKALNKKWYKYNSDFVMWAIDRKKADFKKAIREWYPLFWVIFDDEKIWMKIKQLEWREAQKLTLEHWQIITWRRYYIKAHLDSIKKYLTPQEYEDFLSEIKERDKVEVMGIIDKLIMKEWLSWWQQQLKDHILELSKWWENKLFSELKWQENSDFVLNYWWKEVVFDWINNKIYSR